MGPVEPVSGCHGVREQIAEDGLMMLFADGICFAWCSSVAIRILRVLQRVFGAVIERPVPVTGLCFIIPTGVAE